MPQLSSTENPLRKPEIISSPACSKIWLKRVLCVSITTLIIIALFLGLHCDQKEVLNHLFLGEQYRPDFSDFPPGRVRLDRPVTVVTAYYHIASKYNHESYVKWMSNFLTKIPCHLYIFTEEAWLPMLSQMRRGFANRTKIVTIPFRNLTLAKRLTLWKRQHKLDPEGQVHSPEVYVIWNEKVNFLMRVINDNPFQSDYFLWTDIGSFRDLQKARQLTSYPDTQAVSHSLGTNQIFFLQLGEFAAEETVIQPDGLPAYDFRNDIRLGGGIFGGHRDAVVGYRDIFYQTMVRLYNMGRFVGKDQNIMASIAVMYPDLVKLVRPQPYLTDGNPWFYAQFYFQHSQSLSRNAV